MPEPITFEAKLIELDAIIQNLESGTLPLNELMLVHKRGKILFEELDAELKTAEQILDTIPIDKE